jgi:8-oxo-dGTP pyrophosphatase MutT (NUDIX family)
MSTPVRFDLPRGRVVGFRRAEVRLDSGPHPFAVENAAAIEANWQAERAANPALFDGEVMLLSSLSLEGDWLVGRCHAVRYAALLHWRRHRRPGAEHAYAHAAIVSGDGALVAIRMAAHTANAGKVYFAAGSFERTDFRDGQADLEANMAREVGEETGLDLGAARAEDGYHLYSADGATVVFRRYRYEAPAAELAARIAAHAAAEAEPEIEGPVVLRSGAPLPDGVMEHMRAIVDWHFSVPG